MAAAGRLARSQCFSPEREKSAGAGLDASAGRTWTEPAPTLIGFLKGRVLAAFPRPGQMAAFNRVDVRARAQALGIHRVGIAGSPERVIEILHEDNQVFDLLNLDTGREVTTCLRD